MADTTPVYGFRFLELGDAPDLAAGTENLATDVEAKFVTVDAAIAAINNLDPVVASSNVLNTTSSTTLVAGANPLGVVFVAPPSGKVVVHLSAHMEETINQELATVTDVTRTGGTIGSGTTVRAGTGDRALICGDAVNAGAVARLQATRTSLLTGLTPGSTYNTRVEFQTTSPGACNVLYRELLIVPVV